MGDFHIYQMPDGTWGASIPGTITDGFATKEEALEWVRKRFISMKAKKRAECENMVKWVDDNLKELEREVENGN